LRARGSRREGQPFGFRADFVASQDPADDAEAAFRFSAGRRRERPEGARQRFGPRCACIEGRDELGEPFTLLFEVVVDVDDQVAGMGLVVAVDVGVDPPLGPEPWAPAPQRQEAGKRQSARRAAPRVLPDLRSLEGLTRRDWIDDLPSARHGPRGDLPLDGV
jgi:hypothetical protein